MLFQKKVDRVIDPDKAEEEFEERMEKAELDRKDPLAMILAGLIVFVPAALFVIAVFGLMIWFFFGRYT